MPVTGSWQTWSALSQLYEQARTLIPASLYEFGMCLFERQFRDRSPEDLIRATELLGQAAALAAPGHGDRLKYAHGYGLALWEHYGRTGAPEILPLVIGVYERLLAGPLTAPGDRPLYHFHLCRAAWQHAATSPDPALLDQAIEACERAVDEMPSDRTPTWVASPRPSASASGSRAASMTLTVLLSSARTLPA